jgi:KaiC/GvpD/RAD55 family RecA-like ATPase
MTPVFLFPQANSMVTPQHDVPGEKRFPWVIRTGIPSIDGMFRISEHQVHGDARGGIALPDLGATTSMTIVGPQGTGKSVLAMHIAARYLADCHAAFRAAPQSMPRVCYISTDMTYPVADPMLRRFALHRPNARRVPFTDYGVPTDDEGNLRTPEWLRLHLNPARDTFPRNMEIGLIECPGDDPEALADYLMPKSAAGCEAPDGGPAERAAGEDGAGADAPSVAHMAFVDLAARTAGDDWAFVHRLLGVLAVPEPGAPRHLVVIDAIEGLETFGGQLDAYGEPGLRRTRVAKLIRLAAGKCHVVVLVEEAKEEMVLPEEFVSDVVFRLRTVDTFEYLRRTFQIEKARGQSTVRGRHPYVIRSGRGSTTGHRENYDDPRVVTDTDPEEYQSYIEVFPSLHYASRTLMAPRVVEPGAPSRPPRDERLLERAGFGIEYLDEMLAEAGEKSREGSDPRGLPCSSITGLIGDAGTHKTGLGIAFLGQAFGRMVESLLHDWDAGTLDADADPDTCGRLLEERYGRLAGVPVLVTTQNERAAALAEFFVSRLLDRPGRPRNPRVPLAQPWRQALYAYIESRTICRRLEVHDMPSAVLFNIIKRAIEAGQRVASGGDPRALRPDGGRPLPSVDERYQESWRIRLVIDDLSTIMATYAQVREDSLFLPFLLYHLRREGTTSLIIDTRAGRPDDVVAEEAGFHTDLRALSDNRLYTWPVREFYGDHRVAIAAIPPIARDHRARVREVKRLDIEHGSGKGELFVDPVFELYAGLEEGRPQLVQLEVRLYGETQACCDYGAYLNEIFKRTFGSDAQRSGTLGEVVVNERKEDYNLIRDASYLKVDTRLDHTLLVQIDEFWRQGHAGGELERKYLMENVSPAQPAQQLEIRDPFHTYREARLGGNGGRSLKADFFDVPACDVSNPREKDGVDRVPYLWDFGFMACRRDAWERAAARNANLHEFWRRYVAATGATTAVKRRGIRVRRTDDPSRLLTWRWFLKHACDVADAETALLRRRVPAFDLAAPSAESFSCLVLEVWLSEIVLTLHRCGKDAEAAQLVAQLSQREWSARGQDRANGRLGLIELLQPDARKTATGLEEGELPGWSLELFKSWLLLVEALDLETLIHPGPRPGFAADGAPRETAVAVRHWYKTACAVPDEVRAAVAPLHYGRLPGHFTTRGDWFLAVAPESRSYPLASRALDLLCSIRGNMRRLEQGVGLPTRRLTRRSEGERTSASFRSRLETETGALGTRKHLSYNDILALGACPEGSVAENRDERLGWLWRSGLTLYHRHALTWQSWLFRTAEDWARLKKAKSDPTGRAWRKGFDVYDEIDAARGWDKLPKTVRGLESLQDFPAAIQALRDELWLVDSSISTNLERSRPSGG